MPFVESFGSRADAWRGARAHGEIADPGDVIEVQLGEPVGRGLDPAGLTEWLRAAWRGPSPRG